MGIRRVGVKGLGLGLGLGLGIAQWTYRRDRNLRGEEKRGGGEGGGFEKRFALGYGFR